MNLQPPAIANPSARKFLPRASCFDFYFDEQWPGTFDPARKEEAVVAMLVAHCGPPPQLPPLRDHQHREMDNLQRQTHLRELLAQPKIFPFLFRLRTRGREACKEREIVLSASLRLSLAILHRAAGRRVHFHLYIDQDDGKFYKIGMELRPTIRAILTNGPRSRNPLEMWELSSAEVNSHGGLLPWCDFLCHAVPRGNRPERAPYTNWADAPAWPGYVALDDTEVDAVLQAMTPGDVAIPALLETAHTLDRHVWGRETLADWQAAVSADESLARKLLARFADLYKAPDRDVRSLERTYRILRRHVLPQTTDPPRGCKLLLTALEFHYANHRGDPASLGETAEVFRKNWRVLGRSDPQLAHHTAVQLAVHDFDRFEFERAAELLAELDARCDSPHTPARLKGIIRSTRAQAAALLQRPAEAEEFFQSALAELNEIDDPAERDVDLRRSNNYRIANLADAKARRLPVELRKHFGDLHHAVASVAAVSASPTDYDHALLLRSLYLAAGQEWSEPLIGEYLALQSLWSEGTTHPWEFIWLYRALLLYRNSDETTPEMKRCFDRALTVCREQSQGFTMRLIAAMIACCAYVCTELAEYSNAARRLFPAADSPAGRQAIQALTAMLDNPADCSPADVLHTLPFYYH